MRLAAFFLAIAPLWAQSADQRLARDIFRELIEINTSDSAGDNTRAAEAMAARFRAAGFPEADVKVLGPAAKKGNLVVRLHGAGAARPILFIGHLDVVEARRSDWSVDPFTFLERDGFFYGRGAEDMKGDDAILVSTFLGLKRTGYQPARDLILALTSDEEGGEHNGVNWLVMNHRDLIDAELCINADAGGGAIRNGRRASMGIEAAEKIFVSFRMEATSPGGHSSLPTSDNAIYRLAAGLLRLSAYKFPVHLFDVTRLEFERLAPIAGGQLGADLKALAADPNDAAAAARLSEIPLYNALMRTTCVPTMFAGGHAENALPQTATVIVNCRVLPPDIDLNIGDILKKVVADPKIGIEAIKPANAGRLVPMSEEVSRAVTAATEKYWPGISVIPKMETGASDAVYLNVAGIPTYGVSGIFTDEDDIRAHGRDERILAQSFYDALPFMRDVATALGGSR